MNPIRTTLVVLVCLALAGAVPARAEIVPERVAVPVAADLHLIADAGGGALVAVAHSAGDVLASFDAGRTWVPRGNVGQGHVEGLVRAEDGGLWVGGDGGRLLRSGDGGATWTPGEPLSPTTIVTGLYAASEGRILFMTFEPGTERTAADAVGPATLPPPPAETGPTGVLTVAPDGALMAGGRRLLRLEGDGWKQVGPEGAGTVRDIAFAPGGDGWAVGHGGSLLRSRDGGCTWTREGAFTRNRLRGVLFVDAGTGFAFGDANAEPGALWLTRDAGAT